jgi:molybdenum cofactor guanylyltransferase
VLNPTASIIKPQDISACILAGGRALRMGGIDKGLQPFQGRPLALHTLRRIAPQVGPCMINANRNSEVYQDFGAPVYPDELSDYAGPLSGFLVGLQHCSTPYLLTLPCDTPLFPHDLVAQLAAAFVDETIDLAMASAPELDAKADEQGAKLWRQRPQPVFCLLKRSLMPSLREFLATGGRKIDSWTAQHHCKLVAFDDATAFSNANTLDELAVLNAGQIS